MNMNNDEGKCGRQMHYKQDTCLTSSNDTLFPHHGFVSLNWNKFTEIVSLHKWYYESDFATFTREYLIIT